MQYSTLLLSFASLAAAVTYTGSTISPTAAAPTGCATSYPGKFELGITKLASSKVKRQSDGNVTNALVITLQDSILLDNQGRVGYIANNAQFQFDFNGQAGEKYTAGFSVCSNNTLALGGSAVWWECLSGDFYNIYDSNWAPQCSPVFLDVIAYTGSDSASASTTATTATDGQIGGASGAATTKTSTGPATATATATGGASASGSVVTSVSVSTSSAAIVSSISDHQIQGATTTSEVVKSVTLSSTVTPTPASSTPVGPVISSISDHQIQAPTGTTPVSPAKGSVTPYTGAAAMPTAAAGLLLAAAGAVVALL